MSDSGILRKLLRLLLATVMLAVAAGQAWAQGATCPPSEPLRTELKLPHFAGLLAARKPIRIVAIGGLSTAGNPNNGTVGRAYPDRLKEALIKRAGPLDITVLNKGVARQSAAVELARFETDVFGNKPDLVIWETGTNDAVTGVDRDTFAGQLQSGIEQLRDRNIEVILMNPQFAPQTLGLVDLNPYLLAIARVAEIEDVLLFDRFELMRDWMSNGYFPLENLKPEQKGQLAAAVYNCVAERLADLIVAATR